MIKTREGRITGLRLWQVGAFKRLLLRVDKKWVVADEPQLQRFAHHLLSEQVELTYKGHELISWQVSMRLRVSGVETHVEEGSPALSTLEFEGEPGLMAKSAIDHDRLIKAVVMQGFHRIKLKWTKEGPPWVQGVELSAPF